jgi:hypothetical protein
LIAAISHASIGYTLLATATNNRQKDSSIIATVSALTASDSLTLLDLKLKFAEEGDSLNKRGLCGGNRHTDNWTGQGSSS